MDFTDSVRQQYQSLFSTCAVSPAKLGAVNSVIARIKPNQARYQSVAGPLGIPWFFVAIVHNMECSLNFNTHLHNGDPLTARTVQVPAGRPPNGQPPFTWEQSANDALTSHRPSIVNQTDWSLPAILYRLEGYNGFGYRGLTPPINTPYLWSFSNQYTSGKYVADHVFNPNAVSAQCGAAVILFQMQQNGVVSLGAASASAAASASTSTSTPTPASAVTPVPALTAAQLAAQFDNKVAFSDNEATDAARALQTALNTFPGIHLDVDGKAGRHTSDAYQQVTGHFLSGDPLG
jgi:lysozyme family protein